MLIRNFTEFTFRYNSISAETFTQSQKETNLEKSLQF